MKVVRSAWLRVCEVEGGGGDGGPGRQVEPLWWGGPGWLCYLAVPRGRLVPPNPSTPPQLRTDSCKLQAIRFSIGCVLNSFT